MHSTPCVPDPRERGSCGRSAVEDVHRRPRKPWDRCELRKEPVPGPTRPCASSWCCHREPLDLGLPTTWRRTPSILSIGYASVLFGFPPRPPVFSDAVLLPPSFRERVPDQAGFGWGSVLDVAAEDRFPPIRLPWSLGCLERTSNRKMPSAHNDDRHASGPEGPSARWPEWLDCRGVRRGSRRAAPRRCFHRHGTPGMLAAKRRNPTPLLPRPDEPEKTRTPGSGARDAWWPRQSRYRPTLHKSQTRQTVRPPCTERGNDRSPPPGRFATRQYALEPPSTGSAHRSPSFPGSPTLGPFPGAGPPSEPDGRSRERPQRQPRLLFVGDRKRTARAATRHGARRCCHRRVIPAGQRARNETDSIHTRSDSRRMPQPHARGRKPVVDAAERSQPAARSTARGVDTNDSERARSAPIQTN
jgi:hypothetical protein